MSRRRYRWDEEAKQLVEVGDDWRPTPRVELQTGAHYEGLRATDGTPIDTRQRHAEYMKRNNLALAADFQRTWAELPKKKAEAERAARREAIGRTIHQLENGRHRR